jgi:FemAB-related protein (PEP-CTERM system-associated)
MLLHAAPRGIALEDLPVRTRSGPMVVTTAVSPQEWDAFVDGHRAGTTYHRSEWRSIFSDTLRLETLYLGVRRDSELRGVLPLVRVPGLLSGPSFVSLPFVNYGGIVAADADASAALLRRIDAFVPAESARSVELRHTSRETTLPARTHKVAMLRRLEPTLEAAWTALDRKVRNQVRKAERSGLTVHVGGTANLGAFYQVYSRNMRDLGTPVQSARFFHAVMAALGPRAVCTVVSKGETPMAAAITVRHRDTVEVPWASATLASRALSANSLLYWSLLQQAILAGAKVFDFGRSSPESGTYVFKKQWGAEPAQLYWECVLPPGRPLPSLTPTNPTFGPAIAVWKRLPLSLTTLIGPGLARCLP